MGQKPVYAASRIRQRVAGALAGQPCRRVCYRAGEWAGSKTDGGRFGVKREQCRGCCRQWGLIAQRAGDRVGAS